METESAAAEPSDVAQMEAEETKTEKRVRKRKKKLHTAIQTQMEFYFSDSNLMKDKYLSKVISGSEEGWVPLQTFFGFNKIRSLNCTMKDICKALKRSELLMVSSDEKTVRRVTAAVTKENVDQCTLYVEGLPADVDHDWLRNIFSPFGSIDYISLPRFRQKGTAKGFAFVEFSTPEEAAKASKSFGYVEDESKNGGEESVEQTPKSRRKRGTSESEDSGGRKRVRQSSLSENPSRDSSMQNINLKSEEPVAKESDEEEAMADVSMAGKKKKRSRKKKRKNMEVQEKPSLAIRVMPKEEWKRWKNRYLSMQKATMSQIKMSLSGVGSPEHTRESREPEQDPADSQELLDQAPPDTGENKIRKRDKPIEFIEGSVLRIKMKEPVSKCAELKAQLRNVGDIAYVEVEEGQKIIYLRCRSSEETKRILSEVELPGKTRLLEGEEEKSYWDKLQADRQLKLTSQSKRQKGTKKVLTKMVKKQNKHITFDS